MYHQKIENPRTLGWNPQLPQVNGALAVGKTAVEWKLYFIQKTCWLFVLFSRIFVRFNKETKSCPIPRTKDSVNHSLMVMREHSVLDLKHEDI